MIWVSSVVRSRVDWVRQGSSIELEVEWFVSGVEWIGSGVELFGLGVEWIGSDKGGVDWVRGLVDWVRGLVEWSGKLYYVGYEKCNLWKYKRETHYTVSRECQTAWFNRESRTPPRGSVHNHFTNNWPVVSSQKNKKYITFLDINLDTTWTCKLNQSNAEMVSQLDIIPVILKILEHSVWVPNS